MNVENQKIDLPLLDEKGITLFVKREDTIHPFISGNKYRKLKYNIQEAKKENIGTLLTFGGAYSNHIAATACAGKEYGFETIGIIRGEELKAKWETNPTLRLAYNHGMHFHFVSRENYRNKEDSKFLNELNKEYGVFYLIPEGGTNTLAVKGCEEILTENDVEFDIICACVGTGGTLAGLINSAKPNQILLGFPALKGDFLKNDIRKFARNENWKLISDYHFGGYAKITAELIDFVNDFKVKTGIPLEPIYTGKLFYGLLDLITKNHFKNGTKILAIHSGGLQGIPGMNMVLKEKKLPLLK
ncbi:pyridoxal-phosphate dependent enzyme [Croceitalea sp. MTPC9]|uniref:1-aminocyclopropane-1-carboxylate deaminase/D-cysteine desulfhydrase n=1 Tax=unclassified Croceitalea TaxID=2632280 RepID=UPI002B3ED3D1|nr:pyridoxal-phosphate dependent enzyme [Croceitalea sp. MTPC6]GMN17157.1 pyridoxal-phosphate dependent enzyme [Croceitalea sp. MTPC9]